MTTAFRNASTQPDHRAPNVRPARVRHLIASIPISCSGSAPASCKIKLTLTVTETLNNGQIIAITTTVPASNKPTQKLVVLDTATVALKAGQSRTIQLTLNHSGQHLVAEHKTLTGMRTTNHRSGNHHLASRQLLTLNTTQNAKPTR